MKLTITREQLQEGLVAVAASVPAKTTLPILSNILLEATRDGIRLSGTDLDIAVSTTVSASIDQEGAITLPARKLAGSRHSPGAPTSSPPGGQRGRAPGEEPPVFGWCLRIFMHKYAAPPAGRRPTPSGPSR